MPLSIFQGTRGWPSPGEALFTESDQEAVLDLLREEKLICPGCGQPRDESMSPEAEDFYRSRALRCHGCAAQERAAEKLKGAKHPGSVYYHVEKLNG